MFVNYFTKQCDLLKELYEHLHNYQERHDFEMVDHVLMDIQNVLDELQRRAIGISKANDYMKAHYQE